VVSTPQTDERLGLRQRDPSISAAVDQAAKLLSDDPKMSKAAAARAVGVSPQILSYRLQHRAPAVPAAPELTGEVPVIVREYDADVHYAYPVGDVHMGSGNFQDAKWQEWISYLAENESTSMLGTGDFLNCALKDSVSDVYEEVLSVREGKKKLRQDLRPLAEAGRLDALCPGNHEARVTRATGDCPIEDVAEFLEVPYFAASAFVVYKVGDAKYTFYVRHGSGSGRSSAQAGRLERAALIAVADVYVSGHTHRQQVIRGDILDVVDGVSTRRGQYYVSSGSFLSYEAYAAKNDLPPAALGVPRNRLDGTRKDIHASI
jgi:predicted phosphodiesterase